MALFKIDANIELENCVIKLNLIAQQYYQIVSNCIFLKFNPTSYFGEQAKMEM